MKTRRILLLGLVTGLLVGALAFAWTFVPRPLELGPTPAKLPPGPTARVPVEVLRTGSIGSSHGFSVRGGALLSSHSSAMTAVGIVHPSGYVLVDAGLGTDGEAHFATTPWLMQATASLTLRGGLKPALAEHGRTPPDVAGVLLTHAHWDHVSGLADLPGTPVWMPDVELQSTEVGDHGALFRQLTAARPVPVRPIEYVDEPYGPFAEHLDLFGDGTVVVVPLPGHTPGSVGIFVHTPHQRLLFVGDTTWTREGVDWPAEKPWVSRRMVDVDPAAVRRHLGFLHQLQRDNPGLVIVPAHDGRVQAEIQQGP